MNKVLPCVCCGGVLTTFGLMYANKTYSSYKILEYNPVVGKYISFNNGWTFTNGLYSILGTWLLYKCIFKLNTVHNKTFNSLKELHQTNITTYIMELIYSTCVIIPFVYIFSAAYISGDGNENEHCKNEGDNSLTYCLSGWTYQLHFLTLIFCCLYIFELCVRANSMRISLLIHHFATLCFTAFIIIMSGTTTSNFNVWDVTLGLFQGIFALFEHPTFIAMIFYRLTDRRNHLLKSRLFLFAGIFFFVTKVLSHILGLYYYIAHFSHLSNIMKATYIQFTIIVFSSQVVSSRVQIILFLSERKKQSVIDEENSINLEAEKEPQDKIKIYRISTEMAEKEIEKETEMDEDAYNTLNIPPRIRSESIISRISNIITTHIDEGIEYEDIHSERYI